MRTLIEQFSLGAIDALVKKGLGMINGQFKAIEQGKLERFSSVDINILFSCSQKAEKAK